MIRHIIAGITVVLAVWASVYMWKLDQEVNKLERISELIQKSQIKVKLKKQASIEEPKVMNQTQQANSNKAKDDEMSKKLQALRNKAGNIAAFEVSPLYKKKCASCHGNIGQGIIGPKLMGKSEEFVLQSLKDFKSGKRKNYIMYGLLGSMDEGQLEALAKEISTFQAKLDATKK